MLTRLQANLKALYSKEQFAPSFLGVFVNPFYLARKGIHREMVAMAGHVSGRVLDVGCGRKPYESLFKTKEYVGLEVDTPQNRATKKADHFYDGMGIPFEDNTFDAVICNQVLEHVFQPQAFLKELNRVLKPGGMLILSVPFVWDEHEQPWDYARYSSFGLSSILGNCGFRLVIEKKTLADLRVIFQLINAYIFKITATRSVIANLVVTAGIMSWFSLAGVLLAKIFPGNSDLYLDNVVLAKKARQV
jgi:SAM-dependent methyltransferase